MAELDRNIPWVRSPDIKTLNITGHLFVYHNDEPALIKMLGSDDIFLAIFSTREKLDVFVTKRGLPIQKIVVIDHSGEFLDSLPEYLDGVRFRLIVDPWDTPEGTIRFFEMLNE